jgi:hypothetical protein
MRGFHQKNMFIATDIQSSSTVLQEGAMQHANCAFDRQTQACCKALL